MTLACALPLIGALLCPPSSPSIGVMEFHTEERFDWSLCGKMDGEFVILLNEADEKIYRIVQSRLLHEGLHHTEMSCPREML